MRPQCWDVTHYIQRHERFLGVSRAFLSNVERFSWGFFCTVVYTSPTHIFFGSVAPEHDEASNAWKRLVHIPILFTIMSREPTGTNRRKNGSKHCIGSAIG